MKIIRLFLFGVFCMLAATSLFAQDAQPCPGTPTVTDIDGNVYNTVRIGYQCWMKENLRTTHYADSTPIALGNDTSSTIPYYYYPSGDAPYGLLYNWKAVMKGENASAANPSSVQGICPTGWHVPSDAEWTQLINYVSKQSEYVCGEYANQIVKALAATTGWDESDFDECSVGNNQSANNATGFSVFPSGYYSEYSGNYRGFGSSTGFWSAGAYAWCIDYANGLSWYNGSRNRGFSVRCLQDAETSYVPTVTTAPVSNLSANVATCGGNVIDDGGAEVTERGVCWSTTPMAMIQGEHRTIDAGLGEFTCYLSLTPNTTYYVRAYAINSIGAIAYGEEVSFTTPERFVDLAMRFYDTTNQNFITELNIGMNDDLNFYPAILANGNYPPYQLPATVDTIYLHGTINDTTMLEPSWFMGDYFFNLSVLLQGILTAAQMDEYGLEGSFELCYEVRIAGISTDPVPDNNIACITVNRIRQLPEGDAQPCPGTPTVTDHEGNVYNTVQIGTQCWTRENMRCVTSPSTGTYLITTEDIPYTCTGKQARWVNGDTVAYPPTSYGILYNWNAAVDTFNTEYGELSVDTTRLHPVKAIFLGQRRGICPEGWHIPSYPEWITLRNYLSQNDYGCIETNGIAKSLAAQTGWINPESISSRCTPGYEPETNNATGFSALPTGFYFNQYNKADSATYFWSSSKASFQSPVAWGLEAYSATEDVWQDTDNGFSVRCLRDNESVEEIVEEERGTPCPGTPTVIDHEGNVYNTVQIGSQCWTKENMRCETSPSTGTRFVNNSMTYNGNRGYSVPASGAYWPNCDSAGNAGSKLGLLYYWDVALDTIGISTDWTPTKFRRGICPQGWHVPSSNEWGTLITYASGQGDYFCNSSSSSYIKPLASQTGWPASEVECSVGNYPIENNATGFTAYPTYYGFPYAAYSSYSTKAPFIISNRKKTVYYIPYSHSTIQSETSRGGSSVRCLRDYEFVSVTTASVTDITPTSAVCGGEVISDGGAEVTARGVCWSTHHNPTIADSHTTDGTGDGSFTSNLTELAPFTNYYARAYATSGAGTVYGEDVHFIYAPIEYDGRPCPGHETTTDADGNTYHTVWLGEQCWMRENLRTTHYANGTPIALGNDTSTTTPYYYYPNGDAANANPYGLLYNWKAAMKGANASYANPSGVQGVCPNGWHVPSDVEWYQLFNYVNSHSEYQCSYYVDDYYFYDGIAKALADTIGWDSSNTPCTPGYEPTTNNATGFSALPAGYLGNDLTTYDYRNGFFMWCANQEQQAYIYNNIFYYDEFPAAGYEDVAFNAAAFSVRCVLGAGLSVSTSAIEDIAPTSATCGGNVTSDGGYAVTERGVCWSTSQNPTVEDAHTTDGSGTGTFTSMLTGLMPNTTYYVRAYATNETETAYGEDVSFTTVCNNTTVRIVADDPLTACDGDNIALTANASSAGTYTYQWYLNNQPTGSGTNEYISETLSATASPYTVYVVAEDAYGCSAVSEMVSVTVLPAPSPTISGNTSVCQGEYTTLMVTGGTSYQWSTGGVQSSISVNQGGTYTVTATVMNCSATAEVTVMEIPLPEITVSGDPAICLGSSTTLTAHGAVSYQWSTGEATATVHINAFGIYTVTGTDGAGCSSTASVTVLVSQMPTITISGPSDFCAGDSTTLTANGGQTYLWSNGTTGSSLTIGEAGFYQVIGYNANGCQGTANATVTMHPTATSEFSVETETFYRWNGRYYTESGDYTWHGQTVYGCDSVVTLHLTIRHTAASDDYVTICENELPFTYMDTTFDVGTPEQSTTTFILASGQGYDSVVTLHLTVLTFTAPEITVNGVISTCHASSATLSLEESYRSYLWSTGATTPSIVVTDPGYYWVELTDNNGCTGVSEVTQLGASALITETPSICMVGVENGHNLIVWEELDNPYVHNYQIYRENSHTNVFELLTAVPASQANAYEDTTANPSVRAWRYKVTALDTCRGETPMSELHKTVHLTINRGIGNSWNLIWTHYEGMEFPSYRLYRGTANNNLELIATMPSTLSSYTDYDNLNGALFYQIEVVMDGSCQRRTRDTYTGIRSNIVYNGEIVHTDTTACACEGYEWHDSTYAESGDYEYRYTSDLGYEVSAVLHLTIRHASYGDTTATAEGSFNWYEHTGITESGDYTHTFIEGDSYGCDSIVTLHLTITTGIPAYGDGIFALFPNPTNGTVTLQLSPEPCPLNPEIQIFDIYGKRLQVLSVTDERTQIDLSSYAPGVYLIQLVGDGRVIGVRKVVRQ